MSYINVGATINGANARTKAALKKAIKEDPASVAFYSTSPMGVQFNGTAEDMPEEHILSVVGPDPFQARNWYANVKRDGARITVS